MWKSNADQLEYSNFIEATPMRKFVSVNVSHQFIGIIICLFSFTIKHSNAQSSIKTLFLGNSYTGFNNLPQLVHDVALSAGDTLIFDSHSPGGFRLIDHSTDVTTQSKIASGNWDYVVIQGQSQEPITQNSNFMSGAAALRNQIKQADSCAIVMPYMTWGRKNGDASNCASFPVMCTYQGMDTTIRNKYLNLTDKANGEVSPVSVVWSYIRQNHPGIELYQPDESHPSPSGSYAAACCFYAAIFKKDPTMITYDFGLNAAEASIIRSAAKLKVYDTLSFWDFKKPPTANFRFTKGPGVHEMKFTPVNPDGVHQFYHWDFGDGTTSNIQSPTHTYLANGTYTVELSTSNCNLQGWDTATADTIIQLCQHTPTVYTSHPWLCNYDTLWTQPANTYQWLSGGMIIPGETNQYLSNYIQFNSSGIFSVLTSDNGCTELSEEYFPQPVSTNYYFDALGDPCTGDTVVFAVLHTSGTLPGNEIIKWFKNGTLLSMMSNEDTLLITEGGIYEVKIVDTSSNCPMDTTAYSIEYDCNVMGINKTETGVFASIYPNPASGRVFVEFHQRYDDKQLQFYTIYGRLIRTIEIESARMEIDVSSLPSGIYIIRLNNHYQAGIKLIKQ